MPPIYVYVLKGDNGKRYTGITNNLKRRLSEHKRKETKGGQIIGKFKLLCSEEYCDYQSAREREKFLKLGQGRELLDDLELRTGSACGG